MYTLSTSLLAPVGITWTNPPVYSSQKLGEITVLIILDLILTQRTMQENEDVQIIQPEHLNKGC